MKAVITCGGKGTRLFPFTKELPKEMAPIFTHNNALELKPLIQQIFEELYSQNIRNFCFVTGRTKRTIEDHFSPDLINSNKKNLKSFLGMLKKSNIVWINQLEPKGFGHAVLITQPYVGKENFFIQAGDALIISKKNNPISKLIEISKNPEIEAAFLLRKVKDPKRHGIATIKKIGKQYVKVIKVIEKPEKPESNYGVMPLYFFRKSIFDFLEKTKPGKNNEIQLTDAIQKLIESGKNVVAIILNNDVVIDVGTPESFWHGLKYTYDISTRS